jgi:hypothetical protein
MSDTIEDMTEKVRAGLDQAREAVSGDERLEKLVEDLQKTWDRHVAQLLILAVGLSAFRFRDEKTTVVLLAQMAEAFETRKAKAFLAHRWSNVAY